MTEPNGQNVAPLPAPGKSWLRPLGFGAVLLISGAVIGSALTVFVLRTQAEHARGDPAWLSQRAAVRLIRHLDLTSEQGEQVREIFHAHHERVMAFREKHGSTAREMFAALQAEIEEVLTPEQAEKWRHRIERARERVMREGPRRDRGDPRMGPPRDHGPPRDDMFRRDRRERPDGTRPHLRFRRPEGGPPPEGMPPPPLDGRPPPEGMPPPPPEDMPPPPFPGGTPPHENPPTGNV